MHKEFAGVYPYLVTPVDREERVNRRVVKEMVDHLIAKGIHGLVPLGSTGEVAYLTWEQRQAMVEATLEASDGRVPVIPGVESLSTKDAVAQAKAYERMGVDGLVLILSGYFPLQEADVVRHFRTVAESVDLPIALYNNPQFTRADLSTAALIELANVPNIRYYKDATGNTGRLLTLVNHVGDRIKLFSASAHVPVFVMMLGGVGWMAGPACLIPEQSVALYELCRQQRWQEAMRLQARLWALNEAFQRYSLAGCIKAGLELQGFDVGGPIGPQAPLPQAARDHIARVLREIGAL